MNNVHTLIELLVLLQMIDTGVYDDAPYPSFKCSLILESVYRVIYLIISLSMQSIKKIGRRKPSPCRQSKGKWINPGQAAVPGYLRYLKNKVAGPENFVQQAACIL